MGPLLAVPNFSEGGQPGVIEAIAAAAREAGAAVLDLHRDADHGRSVLTLAADPGSLAEAVVAAAAEAVRRIDLRRQRGIHPRVGVLDVAPVVYTGLAARGGAIAEALVLGDLLGEELGLPVLLYGELGGGRTRAELRRGGPEELARRLAAGELVPDFGPPRIDFARGAVLVSARAPLVAFNLELAPGCSHEDARAIAARIREGGDEGLPGVRALGLWLSSRERAQVSVNVEDHLATPLARVVEAVRRHAEVAATELVGLAPEAALAGFPAGLELHGRRTLEAALAPAQASVRDAQPMRGSTKKS